MPDIASVRAAIIGNVSAVANIGQVNDYERYASKQSEMRGLYESAGQIRGWNLRLTTQRTVSPALFRDIVESTWVLRGFMSLSDSGTSEKVFDALVESVRKAMRADESLGGVAETVRSDNDDAGWQITDRGPVMFAGVLCHAVTMKITTRHFE